MQEEVRSPNRKPKVSISNKQDPYSLVEECLSLIKFEVLKSDSKVLVKPNLVRAPSTSPWVKKPGAYERTIAPDGDISHRETIEAVINILIEHGVKPGNIIVGDAPGGTEAEIVYRASGLHELCEGFGVKLLDLNIAPAEKIPVAGGLLLKEVWIPKVVLEADLRINLATLKVHGATVVSLCLKNWGMGLPPGRYYGLNKASAQNRKGMEDPLPIHRKGGERIMGQETAVSKLIVDVCKNVGYNIGILEGLVIIDNSSLEPPPPPTDGRRSGVDRDRSRSRIRRKSLMLAGDDMVAIDAVGARILGFDPLKINHIRWAANEGLGNINLGEIDVLGEPIEKVEMRSNPRFDQRETMLPSLKAL